MAYEAFLVKSKEKIKNFLDFPASLYSKENLTQDREREEKLIAGNHVLSKYFRFLPILITKNGKTSARGALTLYPKSKNAYLGFFESLDDTGVSNALFIAAEKTALKEGYNKLIGPVDSSFWINYRLKTNRFSDPPYFSEPYNLAYYPALWLAGGFKQTERYVSNIYPKLSGSGYQNPKYQQRLRDFTEKGYQIASPTYETWDKAITEVYSLITTLYSDFPVFSSISLEDFVEHYSGLKEILDFSMTKIAYYNGEAVGFCLCAPNYGSVLNRKLNPLIMLEVLGKRKGCDDYVLLYTGVKPEHKGLGKALGQTIITRLGELEASSIGAFAHEDKVTSRYAEDIIEHQYEYILMEKRLGE